MTRQLWPEFAWIISRIAILYAIYIRLGVLGIAAVIYMTYDYLTLIRPFM